MRPRADRGGGLTQCHCEGWIGETPGARLGLVHEVVVAKLAQGVRDASGLGIRHCRVGRLAASDSDQGLRIPEEVLALEVRHVRANTLLIEQRNIKGKIIPGQKMRHSRRRAPKLLAPVRRDVTEYLMSTGIREGLLFPRRDGEPWKVHDYKNWTRRVWKQAREGAGIPSMPPYDLRHAYASLRIRAGASIPELAEELGHSPQMTVGTYTHVIRELQGQPVVSAEEQLELARSDAPWAREASGA